MNSDFDTFADGLNQWDTAAADVLNAVASYSPFKETKMPRTEPKTQADIIFAGVHSCFLALQTIERLEKDPSPSACVAEEAALRVLDSWGMHIRPKSAPQAPASAETAGPADPVKDLQPPTKIDRSTDLVWPPPEPTLPAVYTENFYIVRDLPVSDPMMVAKVEMKDTNSIYVPTLSDSLLSFGQQLSFLGTARWSSEHECWLMRMYRAELGPRGTNLWVFSKALKPGDEIPKVIDASTMARNNDP